MQDEENKVSSSIGSDKEFDQTDNDLAAILRDVLNKPLQEQDSLIILAKLANFGPGYVRCETLGVYIVTEEFFNNKF